MTCRLHVSTRLFDPVDRVWQVKTDPAVRPAWMVNAWLHRDRVGVRYLLPDLQTIGLVTLRELREDEDT